MKKIITTDKAPAAIGPYSQGVFAAGLLFVSGQLPVDPSTGEIVGGGIAAQTEQSLKNLRSVVEAAGASLSDIVKTTVFLADIADFAEMNEVYKRFFTTETTAPQNPPARSAFQVAALPRGALVEIEAIAVINK